MRFRSHMKDVYDAGFAPPIQDAGYKAFLTDPKEFQGKG